MRERDKSISQPSTPLPLSGEELQNVEWFLKARKMSMRENVTKYVTSAFLEYWQTLPQFQEQAEFYDR